MISTGSVVGGRAGGAGAAAGVEVGSADVGSCLAAAADGERARARRRKTARTRTRLVTPVATWRGVEKFPVMLEAVAISGVVSSACSVALYAFFMNSLWIFYEQSGQLERWKQLFRHW